MRNKVQDGLTVSFTAPYALASGGGCQIGAAIFGVAEGDAASGAAVELTLVGVFDLAKVAAEAWTAGQRVYWDNAAKLCTVTAGSNLLIGAAVLNAANPSSVGRVRLNGSAPAA